MKTDDLKLDDIKLDGSTRAERWKALYSYLKRLLAEADENGDRLQSLLNEVEEMRSANLRIAEALQALADEANQEVQREVSLTLNDMDYDVVIDTAPEQSSAGGTAGEPELDITEEGFMLELGKLPKVGPKASQAIAEYVGMASDGSVMDFARALVALNRDVDSGRASQQALDLD